MGGGVVRMEMTEKLIEAGQGPVLITGAGGGLGREVARGLLKAGRRDLLCHYRTKNAVILEILREYDLDPERHLFGADLSSEEQVRGLGQRIRELHGPLYGLVNIAGASTNAMSWKLSKADFDRVLDANLTTTFLTCREFIPGMREQRGGRVINISSVAAYVGVAGAAHYCAAKAAVVGFSNALAREVAPRGVMVCTIAPGYFDCGLIEMVPEGLRESIRAEIPAGRFGAGNELASLIAYLLSDAGAYCGGQVYHVNGGLYR